ncbi:sigma-54 dependent transcriptional regulator [Desulfovibrio mangrovi]|uniref:sigma-54-dependent transcriptional regulator n=1 Tax=Desulfovibrio mangrovi TaxID=2976983 RepID=UPI0022452596|nr:sigma-54 dependent transcriptional regulator [Desulfovibrio mangrovi]UZP67593.1 sigma-54 dependent transcriptional regulator [Desulfovibrio mangrovi]
MTKIILIDDRKEFCLAFGSMLNRMGYPCTPTHSLKDGLRKLQAQQTDIVFMDVHLPEGNALAHLDKITKSPGTPDVVVITANGDSDSASTAIHSGAWDYLVKPINFATLEQVVTRCLKHRDAKRTLLQQSAIDRGPIIGSSPKMEQALNRLCVVARSQGNVLLSGETGTGKELFAKAIHDNSTRADKPFIVVDCTNLPTTLTESILFGHEKGAFTDAKDASEGLFKQADGGTIFLDEVGDLDLSIQKSFLRVLQEHSFRPLKSVREIKSNFRLIAATNCDLRRMVEEGRFRRDLYYRLRTNTIELPPLRQRPEDIEPLARHFNEVLSAEQSIAPKRFAREFVQQLEHYTWPGNVRDLINAINHAITNSFDSNTLHPHHLPREIRAHYAMKLVKEQGNVASALNTDIAIPECVLRGDEFPSMKQVRKTIIEQMEAEYLYELLQRCKQDITLACETSGLSRARLYELLQKHGFSLKS